MTLPWPSTTPRRRSRPPARSGGPREKPGTRGAAYTWDGWRGAVRQPGLRMRGCDYARRQFRCVRTNGLGVRAVPDPAFEAAITSLTAARDQAEKRADEAQQRADRAEARADELREKLDKLLHDQKAADAVAVEALMKSEELRKEEEARKARGRLRRVLAAWRGE